MGSTGSSISKTSTSVTGTVITRNDISTLQRQMGQTGDEAGVPNPLGGGRAKLYVNTSKAFNINYYLMTDGKSIDSPLSNWQNLGYTKRMVKNDIAKIDAGMKPLSQSVQLTRWVSGDALGSMMGTNSVNSSNISTIISKLETDKSFGKNFSSMLKGTDYTQKSYTSASYKDTHSTFDKAPVKFNMVMRKGTNAIVTNNHAEAEVLGARNSKYNFTGNWRVVETTPTSTGRKQKQLVIDVYL
jgi:hypothetical protein